MTFCNPCIIISFYFFLSFVFVNNFAFGPVVNHHLKEKFQQMKEGKNFKTQFVFIDIIIISFNAEN